MGPYGILTILEKVYAASGEKIADKAVEADRLLNMYNLNDSAEFSPIKLIQVEKNLFIAGDFDSDFYRHRMKQERRTRYV